MAEKLIMHLRGANNMDPLTVKNVFVMLYKHMHVACS